MEYLLDTHTLLWHLSGSLQLSTNAQSLIEKEKCFVHVVSLWEISIKISIGKLSLSMSIDEIIKEINKQEITILPLNHSAITFLSSLPLHHRDPFYRLLISEAITQNLTLISADTQFTNYNELLRIW